VRGPARDYRFGLRLSERGSVVGIGDGIAWIRGLPGARMEELIGFEDGSTGVVFQLGAELLGAILLSQSQGVTAGMSVQHTGRRLEIGVGPPLLGRMVDPLGSPLDGLPAPEIHEYRPLEAAAPPIVERDFVNEPLYTGCKIVDALLPIGKGQRQLLVGDDGVGKSSLALTSTAWWSWSDRPARRLHPRWRPCATRRPSTTRSSWWPRPTPCRASAISRHSPAARSPSTGCAAAATCSSSTTI